MNTNPPTDIKVTDLPDGVEYVLPPRRSGLVQIGIWPVSIALMLMPLGMAVFHFFVLGQFVWPFYFSVFLWPVGVGLYAWRTFLTEGFCQITIRKGMLTAVERFQPFWLTRQLAVAGITRLRIRLAPLQNGIKYRISANSTVDMCYLEAIGSDATPFTVTLLYPSAFLSRFAEILNARLLQTGGIAARPLPEVDFAIGEAGPIRDVVQPPPGSRAILERDDAGLTLTIPALGFWHANKKWRAAPIGLGIFLTVIGVSLGMAGQNPFTPFPLWIMWLTMLAVMYINGRKGAVLALVGDSLLVLSLGWLRSKRYEWKREEVVYIRTGSSNTQANKKPVMELQIFDREKKTGLLAGRDETELEWIATVLRQNVNPRGLEKLLKQESGVKQNPEQREVPPNLQPKENVVSGSDGSWNS